MRITIRLYKRHDLDLLYLYHLENYDFKTVFKTTLKEYINGKQIKNSIPQLSSQSVYSLPPKSTFHLYINENDKEIITWIKEITKGRRNNIMKNIIRNSYPPIVTPYLQSSENNPIFPNGGD